MVTSDNRRAISRAFRVFVFCLLTALVAPVLEPLEARRFQAPGQTADQTARPSRALLDRYCVTCHNERLQTDGLMLDAADINRVDLHRETFEKVVRKLRSGQMPPQGRPRPDGTAVHTFVTALEAELDRVAAAAPNPGWVASHRWTSGWRGTSLPQTAGPSSHLLWVKRTTVLSSTRMACSSPYGWG